MQPITHSIEQSIQFYGWDAKNLLEQIGNAPITADWLGESIDDLQKRLVQIDKEVETLSLGFNQLSKEEINSMALYLNEHKEQLFNVLQQLITTQKLCKIPIK